MREVKENKHVGLLILKSDWLKSEGRVMKRVREFVKKHSDNYENFQTAVAAKKNGRVSQAYVVGTKKPKL